MYFLRTEIFQSYSMFFVTLDHPVKLSLQASVEIDPLAGCSATLNHMPYPLEVRFKLPLQLNSQPCCKTKLEQALGRFFYLILIIRKPFASTSFRHSNQNATFFLKKRSADLHPNYRTASVSRQVFCAQWNSGKFYKMSILNTAREAFCISLSLYTLSLHSCCSTPIN